MELFAQLPEEPKKGKRSRKRTLIIVGVVFLVLCMAGAAAYYFLVVQKTNTAEKKAAQLSSAQYKEANEAIKKSSTDEAAIQKIISEYGTKYETTLKELRESEPDKWTQSQIDKAYFALLYADKMGLKSQALFIYQYIAAAKLSGVNVDNNSAGVTQEELEALKARAEAS